MNDVNRDRLHIFSGYANDARSPEELREAIEKLGPLPRYHEKGFLNQDTGKSETEECDFDSALKVAQAIYGHCRKKAIKLWASNPKLPPLPQTENDPFLGMGTMSSWCIEASTRLQEEAKLWKRPLLSYLGLLILVLILSALAGWLARLLPLWGDVVPVFVVQIATGVAVFVFTHLCLELLLRKNPRMQQLWPFRRLQQFRKGLWTVTVVIVLGIITSLVANRIQNRIDSQPSRQHPASTTNPSNPESGE